MLLTFEPIYILYLAIAIILEVAANVLMKLSHGFERKLYAVIAIICVLAAFTCLSVVVRGIPLSVVYGIWGGVGLVATAILGIIVFGERLRLSGWIGLGLIVLGVWLLKLS